MIKDVLQSIAGVELYPVISLVLFFISFIVMLVWTIHMNKTEIEYLRHMPLDEDRQNINPPSADGITRDGE